MLILEISESYFSDIKEAQQSLHQIRLNGADGFIFLDKDLK